MDWVCSMRGDGNCIKVWLESHKGRDRPEERGTDGVIILKYILGKEGLEIWIGYIWLRIGIGGGLL
jgi:hypothetical protein